MTSNLSTVSTMYVPWSRYLPFGHNTTTLGTTHGLFACLDFCLTLDLVGQCATNILMYCHDSMLLYCQHCADINNV